MKNTRLSDLHHVERWIVAAPHVPFQQNWDIYGSRPRWNPFPLLWTKNTTVLWFDGGSIESQHSNMRTKPHEKSTLNTLKPKQRPKIWRRHFKCINLNENFWASNNISLKYVPCGGIASKSVLVQIMAWHRLGDKPLPEEMLTKTPRIGRCAERLRMEHLMIFVIFHTDPRIANILLFLCNPSRRAYAEMEIFHIYFFVIHPGNQLSNR